MLSAFDGPSLVAGVTADYGNTVATNFPLRAQALAAEIAAAEPTVVGLQEVATGRSTGRSYDSLQLLVGALAARGEHYEPVICAGTSVTAPGFGPARCRPSG